MRRANGTGTVVKLPGNRRRPYAVRVPSRNKYGRVIQTSISYHAKMQEAQAALDEYNKRRAEGAAPAADRLSVTFQQVYDGWSERKFAKAGDASKRSYRASWGRLSRLAGLKMRDVTIDHLQKIIDQDEADGLSKSSIQNDKILMSALFKFAMERDIIVKDYSAFVEMPTVDAKFEKGAFSDLQMAQLEKLAAEGMPWADTVLMLCYTGFRITEFLTLTRFSYDRENDCLRGGMKTQAGKDRSVPVHPKIKPHLDAWLAKDADTIVCSADLKPVSSSWYRDKAFPKIAEALGAPGATPHWCRHTFASRLHAAGADQLAVKRILGHADKNVTEHYTHTEIALLRAAIGLLA